MGLELDNFLVQLVLNCLGVGVGGCTLVQYGLTGFQKEEVNQLELHVVDLYKSDQIIELFVYEFKDNTFEGVVFLH